MSINGTFAHDKNENFIPFLNAIGVKDGEAEKLDAYKPTVGLTTTENEFIINTKGKDGKEDDICKLTLGSPSPFSFPDSIELELNLTISGNVAKGSLKSEDNHGEISLEFDESGFVETMTYGGQTCKRYYKRI